MKNSPDSEMMKPLKIRFVPKNNIREDPVNRMRCFSVIKGLRNLGWDADVLRKDECCDILIILSLEFERWLSYVEKVQKQGTKVIFDLSDNEYRRRAEISIEKVKGSGRYIGNPVEVFRRVYFFLKRRRFDMFLDRMVRSCDAVSVSTHQMENEIRRHRTQVYYVPDIIDLDQDAVVKQHTPVKSPVLVWVGMPNNTIFLKELSGVLLRLQKEKDLRIHLITSPMTYGMYHDLNKQLGFSYTLIPWSLDTLARELFKGDIAFAPLPKDISKSANKILTYWFANLPVVCSPSEDYKMLVVNDHNGYLAKTEEEWYGYLKKLTGDYRLREKLATNGRSSVLAYYNSEAITKQWAQLCHRVKRRSLHKAFYCKEHRAHA